MAKFRNTDTGEIVNVVAWGANGTYTDYYDSKGVFHHSALNRYNHFEEIIERQQNGIDWEQRRYEIAKEMLSAIYIEDGMAERAERVTNSDLGFEYKSLQGSAKEAVRFADALIKELKKQDNG